MAAPQLVAHLWGSKKKAFRLRLVDVMITIAPAARDGLAPAFIGLIYYQPEEALREAGWAGLLKLGAWRAEVPQKKRSTQ